MLQYKKVMAEWKACETVVRLREKESQTVTTVSSGSSIDSHVQRLIHRDSTISNDVSIVPSKLCEGVLVHKILATSYFCLASQRN